MTEAMPMRQPATEPESSDEAFATRLWLRRFWKRYWRLLVYTPLLATVGAAVWVTRHPGLYQAQASIVIPDEQPQRQRTSTQEKDIYGPQWSAWMDPQMLHSRAILDPLIDKYHLQEVYVTSNRTRTRFALEKNVWTKQEGDILWINVLDSSAERSAAMANDILTEMDRVINRLSTGSATARGTFLVDRLAEARKSLRQAEDLLVSHQTSSGLLTEAKQVEETVVSISYLRREIAMKRSQLAVLELARGKSDGEVQSLRAGLAALIQEVLTLEGVGSGPKSKEASDSSTDPLEINPCPPGYEWSRGCFALVQLSKVPTLQLVRQRLARDVSLYDEMVRLLTRELELAKIQEANTATRLSVLDRAEVPDQKSYPRPLRTMGLVGVFALCGALVCCLLLESLRLDPC